VTLTLVDNVGRAVRTQRATATGGLVRGKLDVGGLPAGLYLLRTEGAGESLSQRLVVR